MIFCMIAYQETAVFATYDQTKAVMTTMTEILLPTKLFVPQIRLYLVPRPRLYEKLDAGLNGRVTLISAPAGYGKTTPVVVLA